MMEVVDLGASGIEASGTIWATCKGSPVDDDDAPDYGRAPIACALGLAARPFRKNDAGFAQGFILEAPGYDGVVIGAHDSRCASTYGNLGEGETALFATGEDFDSRVILGDRIASLVVGDDMVLQIDGKKKSAMVNSPGGTFLCSKDAGVCLVDEGGKALIQLKGGNAMIGGKVVLGGRAPFAPVADANKVLIELTKISAALTAIAAAVPTANSYVVPTPVGAPGVFIGK